MEQKGFIKKIADAADCRSYSIALTAAGKLTAEKSSNFAFAIEKPLGSLTGEKKEIILSFPMRFKDPAMHNTCIISFDAFPCNCKTSGSTCRQSHEPLLQGPN